MLLYGSTQADRPTFSPDFAGVMAAENEKSAAAAALWDTSRELARYRDNSDAADNAFAEAYERRNKAIFDATGQQLENPYKKLPAYDNVPGLSIFGKTRDWRGEAEAEWQRKTAELARARPELESLIRSPIADDAYAITRGAEADAGAAEARASAAGVGGLRRSLNTLGGGLAGGLRDPMQIATLWVGGGVASPAKMVGARLIETMLTEAALNAGVESAVQIASHDYKARAGVDASLGTSLKQVGLAAAFGGGFGGLLEGGRAVFHALGRDVPPALDRIAAGEPTAGDFDELAVALDIEMDAAWSRQFDLAAEQAAMDREAFGPPPAGMAPGEADQLAATALRMAEDETDVPVRPRPGAEERAAQVERIAKLQGPIGRAPRRPQTLLQFLSGEGGLRDDAGELASRDVGKWRARGYRKLLQDGGRTLDQAREIAEEAGYIGTPGDYQTSTTVDLLNAIDEELAGKPRYAREDEQLRQAIEAHETAVRGREQYRNLVAEVSAATAELGIDHQLDDSVLIRAAQLLDDETSPASALERALDEDYRAFLDDRASRGEPNYDDSDIPFFEDAGAVPGAGGASGSAGGAGAGERGGAAGAGEQFPGAGAGEGAGRQGGVEPGTPEAADIAALALTEARRPVVDKAGQVVEERNPKELSVWDAMPAGRDAEGNVTHMTHADMLEDAERSELFSGLIASCKD